MTTKTAHRNDAPSLAKNPRNKNVRGFIMVGLIATAAHFTVLHALLRIGLPLIPSNITGYLSALIVAYLGNRYFVFGGSRNHSSGFALLAAGYLTTATLHTGLMVAFTSGYLNLLAQKLLTTDLHSNLDEVWHSIAGGGANNFVTILIGPATLSLSTLSAFLIATGISALLNFWWNKLVVFAPAKTDRVA